jgi:hypothetical protein
MFTNSRWVLGGSLIVCLGLTASACTAMTGGAPDGGSGSGSSGADFCTSVCSRVHDCDQTQDQDTCVNACKDQYSNLASKLRSDVVSAVDACIQQKDCRTVLSSSFVTTCVDEAAASIAPSSAATQLCNDLSAAAEKCGGTLDQAKCLEAAKPFDDDALGSADACAAKACSQIGACVSAALD